ncbi:hypothetical protein ES705_28604 [subsurface metagenome]
MNLRKKNKSGKQFIAMFLLFSPISKQGEKVKHE